MSVSKIIANNSARLLSGLANNDSSIIPMATKDTISNGAIVYTYKKEGGKDDARERAIEEFGTGAIWLFGIPAIKKIIDKTIYPFLKLDSGLDVRILKDKDKLAKAKNSLKNATNEALKNESKILSSLDDKNAVLKKFTNAQLYKGLSVGKFAVSTALSALALNAIIDYKQKTTQKRIEHDFYKNHASKIILNNEIEKSANFSDFTSKKNDKTGKNISFKGLGSLGQAFMYNPIVNTMILDGVITGKRLAKARHGERKEVALKEAFQLIFIYALAKPIEKGFEFAGSKLNLPIGLDPMALFDDGLTEKLPDAKESISNLLNDNNIFSNAKNDSKKGGIFSFFKGGNKLQINDKVANPDALVDKLRELDPKNALIEILDKNGAIPTIKDKNGNIVAISNLKSVDEAKIIKTFKDIDLLSNNISKLGKVKAFKAFAVVGNVLLAAWAMGVLQPKINIWMRKLLNNGDNRNPAIVEQERQMQLNAQKNNKKNA